MDGFFHFSFLRIDWNISLSVHVFRDQVDSQTIQKTILCYAIIKMMVKETQALCSWGTISHYSEMGSLLFKQMIIIGQYKYLEQVFNICVWEKYIEKNVFIHILIHHGLQSTGRGCIDMCTHIRRQRDNQKFTFELRDWISQPGWQCQNRFRSHCSRCWNVYHVTWASSPFPLANKSHLNLLRSARLGYRKGGWTNLIVRLF